MCLYLKVKPRMGIKLCELITFCNISVIYKLYDLLLSSLSGCPLATGQKQISRQCKSPPATPPHKKSELDYFLVS